MNLLCPDPVISQQIISTFWNAPVMPLHAQLRLCRKFYRALLLLLHRRQPSRSRHLIRLIFPFERT